MLKIINWILTKREKRLSKKEKCIFKSETTNEKLKLYRTLLNEIDNYYCRTKNVCIYRHYRYIRFKDVFGEIADCEIGAWKVGEDKEC